MGYSFNIYLLSAHCVFGSQEMWEQDEIPPFLGLIFWLGEADNEHNIFGKCYEKIQSDIIENNFRCNI